MWICSLFHAGMATLLSWYHSLHESQQTFLWQSANTIYCLLSPPWHTSLCREMSYHLIFQMSFASDKHCNLHSQLWIAKNLHSWVMWCIIKLFIPASITLLTCFFEKGWCTQAVIHSDHFHTYSTHCQPVVTTHFVGVVSCLMLPS